MSATVSTSRAGRVIRFMPVAFAIGGALSRFAFPWVETRFHISWFWVAAFWAQFFAQSASRARVGIPLLLLNGTAATFAILLTKFALEGFPLYASKALMGLF
ncbi:hypothetical protein [Sphingomonas sp.]|uniref:hypothetical protein n=1 Tax=Sphingomonas sp. TaxID=28214 RepID=UPI0025E180F8|nr:hypothetical protein [Sphingomonas sp.]MBV9527612.1 hypothetical protein [Sphingomonas sp.]